MINTLIDKKVIELNNLTKFLNDSGNFDDKFFSDKEVPSLDNVLENIESELNL